MKQLAAAAHGARSIAIPAVSAGARGCPPTIAAMISLAVARNEVWENMLKFYCLESLSLALRFHMTS